MDSVRCGTLIRFLVVVIRLFSAGIVLASTPCPLETELSIAKRSQDAGDLEAARRHYRAAMELCPQTRATDRLRQQALSGLVATTAQLEDYTAMVDLLIREISIRDQQRLISDFDYVLYHRWLGEAYSDLRDFIAADKTFETATRLAERFYKDDEVRTLSFQTEIAFSHKCVGRIAKAEAKYREIINGLRGSARDVRLAKAHALNGLGGLLSFSDRKGEAKTMFGEAVAIAEKYLPATSSTRRIYVSNLRSLAEERRSVIR